MSTERVPIILLTGFLGAGKTTWLNRLLREPGYANTAVVINELGAVGNDGLRLGHDGLVRWVSHAPHFDTASGPQNADNAPLWGPVADTGCADAAQMQHTRGARAALPFAADGHPPAAARPEPQDPGDRP